MCVPTELPPCQTWGNGVYITAFWRKFTRKTTSQELVPLYSPAPIIHPKLMKNQSFRIFGSVLQVIALSLLGTTAVEDAFGSDTNMVVAWGAGTTNSGLSPHYGQSIVPSNLTEVVAIAGGGYYSLALRSDGTVVGWGQNNYGQINVPPGLTNVMAIAAGNSHSLALKDDGTVVAWGQNSYGQTNIPPGLENVVAIAAGNSHSLALKDDGTVVAWGQNSYGQTNIPPGLENVVAIASGEGHNLAL